MSITLNNVKEMMSVSYVGAVVSKAGFSFDVVKIDYGVDTSVREVKEHNKRLIDVGVVFDMQLKATVNWVDDGDNIKFSIKKKDYENLVYRNNNSYNPCILILMCLPKDLEECLDISTDEMILRKCCYYTFLDGTEKKKTVVYFPKKNVFNCDAVISISNKVKKGRVTSDDFK